MKDALEHACGGGDDGEGEEEAISFGVTSSSSSIKVMDAHSRWKRSLQSSAQEELFHCQVKWANPKLNEEDLENGNGMGCEGL